MRPPISFVYGNCVFAETLTDPWAAFVVSTHSYETLPEDAKLERLSALVGALESCEADIQLLRVSRRWDVDAYVGDVGACAAGAAVHRTPAATYVDAQAAELRERTAEHPALFALVRLREPARDVAAYVSQALERRPRDVLAMLRAPLRALEKGLLSVTELERTRERADRVHARLRAFLAVRPARVVELQWLVRRAFCRALGEPAVEGLHAPRALAFECNGEAVLAPLEGDLLRWAEGLVEHRTRLLRIESELGVSWQAHLVLGALPERVRFPSPRLELMFAPPECLPFGIDMTLSARFLPNDLAVRLARRKIQDADQILSAESEGEQGASDEGYERTQDARDLLGYLRSASRPPLLRATVALAVSAPGERMLEQRVELCRRAFGEVRLHRPLGDQLELFRQQLPGQGARVPGYDDALTCEQAAALMPTATHVAGSRRGFYLGRTLTGSARPLRFNLREGSERSRNSAILVVGALGSGKTTLVQKLKYEAFLEGARIVDCDPKGDHRFHLLDEVAEHVECVPLRPEPALRGMLDPLRVAPVHLRHEAAVSLLCELLPARAEPAWEAAVVRAVDVVIERAAVPTCLEVVRALAAGEGADADVAATLQVYARGGLTQLAFGDASSPPPEAGRRQVTYLPIRDLPGPEPGTPRSEYTQAERIGEQIVRLIAMFAMQLMGAERDRLKLFCFDEGWRLLGDPAGRSLLASLQRMGRSELAVPVISTQLVTDALMGERESLANLLGAVFVFGMRSEEEAARALRLLGADAEDRSLRRRLLEMDRGRCLFRDHLGRVEAVGVEVLPASLLTRLSTTPSSTRRGPRAGAPPPETPRRA